MAEKSHWKRQYHGRFQVILGGVSGWQNLNLISDYPTV